MFGKKSSDLMEDLNNEIQKSLTKIFGEDVKITSVIIDNQNFVREIKDSIHEVKGTSITIEAQYIKEWKVNGVKREIPNE